MFFPDISAIPYEGPSSMSSLAFKYVHSSPCFLVFDMSRDVPHIYAGRNHGGGGVLFGFESPIYFLWIAS